MQVVEILGEAEGEFGPHILVRGQLRKRLQDIIPCRKPAYIEATVFRNELHTDRNLHTRLIEDLQTDTLIGYVTSDNSRDAVDGNLT
jgi:hypothetical protein